MWFVAVGLVLLLCKVLDIGPVAGWAWWQVLLPFGLAAVWWAFADSTGLTQRRAMRRQDERTQERREKAVRALGLDPASREGRKGKPPHR